MGAFGAIDANSADGRRVLNAKAVASSAERDAGNAELHRRLNALSKRDAMNEKVATAREPAIQLHVGGPGEDLTPLPCFAYLAGAICNFEDGHRLQMSSV